MYVEAISLCSALFLRQLRCLALTMTVIGFRYCPLIVQHPDNRSVIRLTLWATVRN